MNLPARDERNISSIRRKLTKAIKQTRPTALLPTLKVGQGKQHSSRDALLAMWHIPLEHLITIAIVMMVSLAIRLSPGGQP